MVILSTTGQIRRAGHAKAGLAGFSIAGGGDRVSHEQFAQRLYRSYAWQRCRAAYIQMRGGLCERCLAQGLIVPGVEVHHKVRLTPETVDDPAIALCWDNLELLCAACHQQEHRRETQMRTDERGHVEI